MCGAAARCAGAVPKCAQVSLHDCLLTTCFEARGTLRRAFAMTENLQHLAGHLDRMLAKANCLYHRQHEANEHQSTRLLEQEAPFSSFIGLVASCSAPRSRTSKAASSHSNRSLVVTLPHCDKHEVATVAAAPAHDLGELAQSPIATAAWQETPARSVLCNHPTVVVWFATCPAVTLL